MGTTASGSDRFPGFEPRSTLLDQNNPSAPTINLSGFTNTTTKYMAAVTLAGTTYDTIRFDDNNKDEISSEINTHDSRFFRNRTGPGSTS